MTTRESDKFMLRLPDGMRQRIKAAADANGRSMNSEIISVLSEWYPEPTEEEYLAWLHKDLVANRAVLEAGRLNDAARNQIKAQIAELQKKMVLVIEGKADPSSFADEIARMSDFNASRR